MAKKKTRKKKTSTNTKLINAGAGMGRALAAYKMIGATFGSMIIIGMGILIAMIGGTADRMSPEQIEEQNKIRRAKGQTPLSKNQLSRGAAIGIGAGLILLGLLVFGSAYYTYKFVSNNKGVAAVYGGVEGIGMLRANAPRPFGMQLI